MDPHSAVKSGEVIDVQAGSTSPVGFKISTLIKTSMLEVKRLNLPQGKEIPRHQAQGEITVHCLSGRVAFTAGEVTRELAAGQILHLDAGTPHALVGLEDSTLLVTKLAPAPAVAEIASAATYEPA